MKTNMNEMKKLNLLLLSMLISVPLGALADNNDFRAIDQKEVVELEYSNTNIDENGKRNRGSYLTNPWYSNWSVGLSGGIQTMVSGTGEHNTGFDTGTARLTPSIELTVAKWFTPVIGIRFGFQGFWLEEHFKLPDDIHKYNHYTPKHDEYDNNYYTETYFHGDMMWNIINSFWGYKANRFYNVIPYAQFGYMRLCHPDDPIFNTARRDREFQVGLGINNTFRISNAFQATLDLRWGNMDGRFHDIREGERVNHFTLSAGIAYNIEKWYFVRAKSIEAERDQARTDAVVAMTALNEIVGQNETLKEEVEEVKAELAEYEKLPKEEFQKRVDEAGLVVYYEINISKPNFSEQHHIDKYVKETLEQDPNHVFYLTGSADEGTGNFEINTRLSHDRAYGIKEMLMKQYNVPEDQIVIKATIISAKHEDGSLDRCVLLENR